MSTRRVDTDQGERARLLAIEIAGCIAEHCPSRRASHYAALAVSAVGALATRESLGNVDAVAVAAQHTEELRSISSVCPNRRACGIDVLSAELSDLLPLLPH